MKTLKVTLKYSLSLNIEFNKEDDDALHDIQETAERKLREWLNDDFSTIEVDDDIEVEVPGSVMEEENQQIIEQIQQEERDAQLLADHLTMDEPSTETTKNHQQQLFDLLPPRYQHLAELPDEICESLIPLAEYLRIGGYGIYPYQASVKFEKLSTMSRDDILAAWKDHIAKNRQETTNE